MTKASKGSGTRARRAFSAEFKVEAVRLMGERRALGVSLAQVGRELAVRPDLLRKWARRLAQRLGAVAGDVFPGNGKLPSAEDEVRRLQRENVTLRQERDFSKKAAAFFAKESRRHGHSDHGALDAPHQRTPSRPGRPAVAPREAESEPRPRPSIS